MKATIVHESLGRIRLRLSQKYMSIQQADRLELWLQQQPFIKQVVVHERTCCAIIHYSGSKEQVLACIGGFSWKKAEETLSLPMHSSRALNRAFEEKLVQKVLTKAAATLFLPKPLRLARIVVHAVPFLRRGLGCLLRRQMRIEVLDGFSIGLSMCRRDFGTAGMVMFLLELGELLEEWTRRKSVEDLARCMSLQVDRVWVWTTEGEVLLPVSQVKCGDHVILRAGSVIPFDGRILEGELAVNQASFTGEPLPVQKSVGKTLYAGTVVEGGEAKMEVMQLANESRYAKIVAMIEQSEQLKSVTESKATRLADRLVPYTFGASLLCLGVTRQASRAISVLMVDFSCALKLAIPLAVLSAMRQAGKHHITVKGGKFLEAISKADTVVFDKTGTLTHACPKVAQVIAFDGKDPEEMLRLAACLEEHFPHSMAKAVVEEAKQRGLEHEEFHTKVEYIVAHGIASTVDGQQVRIGSAHYIFEDCGCVVPEGEEERFAALPDQYSHLYLAIGQYLCAVLCIADPLRAETKDVLAYLKQQGIQQTVMLTGDSFRTACAIAQEVGVDQFQAEVLPEDKANYVAKLKEEGHTVLMVGDGINDSPALSKADVGIAIQDGAAIAQEIADVTLSAESLWELVLLRQIAMALMERIRWNYRFVVGFNGSLILAGLAGLLSPGTSALLHNLSTLAISFHSMGPLQEPSFPRLLS